ncbi:hypothetical protein [Roseateles sp. L2-2]|uniref:hypothetical protein n=1 Tax=Roseateles sp. L2-2 TaxID=3422597 RepID=UPI003D36088A
MTLTVGRGLLSSDPRPVDDFSGSGLLSRLRILKRIRNLDGPDDVAGALPAAFSTSHQPAAELGLLSALFPLVALSAKEAVKSAHAGYARVYPEHVRAHLDQQQRLIESLQRDGDGDGDGDGDEDLARLAELHADCVRSFEDRERERTRGFGSLLKHNLTRKWQGRRGTSALCGVFLKEAGRVVEARAARGHRLQTAETSYQHHLAHKAADLQRQAKRARWPALFTGIGMSGMAGGMVVSAGASAAGAGCAAAQASGHAAGLAAAQAAQGALDAATGGVMIGAQAAQMAAGATNLRVHLSDHRRIRRDRTAVQAIAADIPRAGALHAQDTQWRLADSRRSQACDLALSAGQGLMLASSASGFVCPPVALALAGPGIALTLGASIGAGVNEAHRERYLGEATVEPLKRQMRLDNLGQRLRDEPLDTVLHDVADGFEAHQDRVAQTRLWSDILAVLGKEDVGERSRPAPAQDRYRRLLSLNQNRRTASPLLPAGVERLHALRRAHYPEAWFDGPAATLHERLSADLRQHPASARLLGLQDFQRDVLFATVSALARRRDPVMERLFYDDRGRRLKTLKADAAFLARLRSYPVAKAILLRHENEALARHLTSADRFGRADTREALTDLAHTKVGRQTRDGDRPVAA